MSLKLDYREFDDRLKKLVEQSAPKAIEQGLGKAGGQWLNDAVMKRPTVPLKEGTLRGSGSVHVNGKFVMESPHGKKGKANTGPTLKGKLDFVQVGFNTPYAARLHEGINMNFSERGSGPKFLEQKMKERKKLYLRIIANSLKEAM